MPRSKRNLLLAVGGIGIGAWLLRRKPAVSVVRAPDRSPGDPSFDLAFVNPVTGGYVTSVWGDSRDYRKGIHRGIDIRAPKGAPVCAAVGGTVVRVDRADDSTAGLHVVLKTRMPFGGTLWHRYLHLDSIESGLSAGDRLDRTMPLGAVGDTFGGRSMTNPHLHFDMLGDAPFVARYVELYGEPKGGIPGSTKYGRPVPAEPFIPVPYTQAARDRATKLGIPVLGSVRSVS